MNKKRIFIDMDGVLADFESQKYSGQNTKSFKLIIYINTNIQRDILIHLC